MTVRSFWLSLALVGCWSSHACAQAVQLPSFSFFGVDTSVMAPDRGSAYIGGVRRVSSGSTAFGPGLGPRRAIGGSTSASQLRAKATIHDFAAHDEALRGNSQSSTDRSPARGDESSAARAPQGSLAEARRQYAAELAANDEAVQESLGKARKSAADGKLGAARIFYKMAARDASPELRRKIEREIDVLTSRSDSPDRAKPDQATKRPRAKSPKASGPRGF